MPAFDGMQDYARMKFLYQSVLAHAAPSGGVALELGCLRCPAPVYLARACHLREIHGVYAIDSPSGTKARLLSYSRDEMVTLTRSDTPQAEWKLPIDVLHIDGHQDATVVTDNIERYLPHLTPNGIVILDDNDSHPAIRSPMVGLLLQRGPLRVVDVGYEGKEYRSICLRKTTVMADVPARLS